MDRQEVKRITSRLLELEETISLLRYESNSLRERLRVLVGEEKYEDDIVSVQHVSVTRKIYDDWYNERVAILKSVADLLGHFEEETKTHLRVKFT